jgi:hypothetical protein
MKNFIPLHKVAKIVESATIAWMGMQEEPMNMEEAAVFLKYKNLVAFRNVYKKYPHHLVEGKEGALFYKSELNAFIRQDSDIKLVVTVNQ